MKKTFFLALSMFLVIGCEETKTFIPDNSAELQTQAELAEAAAELVALRFDALEARVTDLESRMDQVETRIDSLSGELIAVLDRVSLLEQADQEMRDELASLCAKIQALKHKDRELRREYTRRINDLYWRLCNEIRNRQLADQDLQNELDGLQEELDSAEAHQQFINRLLFIGMAHLHGEIAVLSWKLEWLTYRFENFKEDVQDALAKVKSDIGKIKSAISNLNDELDEVRDDLVSVVYPCGSGAGKEVLLKTQDGLVGVFLYGENKTFTVNDSDTIPEHAICTQVVNLPAFLGGPTCLKTAPVAASTSTQSQTITYYSVTDVRLGKLTNGTYNASSGWSCTFTVQNGRIQ